MAAAVVRNAQDAVYGAHSATNTGSDDASDRTAYRTGDPVTLVGPFLGATHDALAVAGLRHASQGEKDGSAREKQANGSTRRQLRGGDTGFVHLESPEMNGGERRLSGRSRSTREAAKWLRLCDELSAM